MSKEFEKLEGLSISLGKSLKAISVDSSGFRSITTATNSATKAFERANLSASAYEARLASIHRLGGAMGGGGAARALPSSGGGGGGRAGVGSPGQRMHGGNIHLGSGGVGLGTVGMAAGDYFWPLAASGAAMYAGKSLFDSARELDTERQKFRLFGMSEAQNQEAFKFASGMHVYGSTQTGNMAAFREAQGVFRESGLNDSSALAGAKLAAPVLAKLDFLASSLDDDGRASAHAANMNMLRYVESSGGLTSAAEFNRIADFGYKLNASSGGTVDWAQLRQLKARAGAAGFHLTDDALARLEPIIGELKGGATGFGLSTSFNRLTGATRVPNQIAHELVDNGIWDASKIMFNQNGGIKQFIGAGGPLSKDKIGLLSTNPELFYERYIKPMYEKMKLDSAEIARQNVMLFGSTGGRNMTLVDNQLATIHRSIDALNKTKGIDASMNVGKESLSGQMVEFDAAWKDFKTQWGTTILPFFTGVLKAGASLLRPSDAATPWYTSFAKGLINPFGSVFHALEATNDWAKDRHFVGGTGGNRAVSVVVSADARKMGITVTNEQGRAFARPQTGGGFFDSLQSATPAGGL